MPDSIRSLLPKRLLYVGGLGSRRCSASFGSTTVFLHKRLVHLSLFSLRMEQTLTNKQGADRDRKGRSSYKSRNDAPNRSTVTCCWNNKVGAKLHHRGKKMGVEHGHRRDDGYIVEKWTKIRGFSTLLSTIDVRDSSSSFLNDEHEAFDSFIYHKETWRRRRRCRGPFFRVSSWKRAPSSSVIVGHS